MTGPFATRLFRIIFILAGCYNLAFGIWAAVWPLHFFELFNIPAPRYPAIWACLGMVVGVYGLLYWCAAWQPETAKPIIAVGLLGKLLGPVGMLMAISDQWPLRLAMINVFNDVIWWLPFALFLLRGTRVAQRLIAAAPWACIACHVLGLLAIVFALRPGLLSEPEIVHRATYVAQHPFLWTFGWIAWLMSAQSLVAFYAWWGSFLSRSIAVTVAVLIAAAGSVCDFTGESLSAIVLVERSFPALESPPLLDQTAFHAIEQANFLLTAGVANLLYTIGGIMLTLSTPNLPPRIRAAMWGTWLAGVAMTVSALLGYVDGVVATTAMLFPAFIGWLIWMGRRGRPS